ncbi:MAG: trypsin-like peptidase domain-containing protein, partial [Thermoleophilaceae bacterium]
MRALAAAAGAALALAAAGCDSSDEESSGSGSTTRNVTTTRVEVVEGIGREGGFNPAQIYSQLSPGVVTVISIFDGPVSVLEDGGEGGQGSGFVLDDKGYIATNAHVVTSEDDNSAEAERVFVQFSDGNRVP